jgi:hypothetical protein
MSGDSTKANIITDIDVGRDQMQYCFFNHNVVKTSLTLIEMNDLTWVGIGINKTSTTDTVIDATGIPNGCQFIKLQAHPFLDDVASTITEVKLPSVISYIGSGFFKGISSSTTINIDKTKTDFDAMTKATDWWDGLATTETLAESRFTFKS